MPRFFFHYRGPDEEMLEDRVGSQLADVDAAEREAQALALDILEEELGQGGSIVASRCLEVEDEHGEIVLYLPFWGSLVVEPSGAATPRLQ
jgi:hypothetical protein